MRWHEVDDVGRARLLGRGLANFDPDLLEGIRRLIEDVRLNGDDAVVRALRDFDGCQLEPDELAVTESEFAKAKAEIPDDLLRAIRESIGRVRAFNERVLGERDWMAEIEAGIEVGQKTTPITSAGLFVPSGKGSYPSSLFQIVTPAVVAGVPKIAIAVPPLPGSEGKVDPAVLVVATELGIDRVFRTNGPAGIAALAFGTASIPQAVKVLGPGSPPVQAAQVEIQRYGTATVMMLGPTESMIVADGSADPRLLAADLLSEAEHGSDSAAVLVTAAEELLEAVHAEIASQLAALPEPRRAYARAAISQVGGAIVIEDLEQAVDFANLYAPEHLQVATAQPDELLSVLDNAAEVLLGQGTPFAAANYAIGVPAALPTGRFARVSSGVTAEAFVKKVSVARLDEQAIENLGPAALALAEWEGFPAHAAAVRMRRTAETALHQEVR
ncbi:MAG: histidinol dehydrogenase [Solirubrobacterales bacterium]